MKGRKDKEEEERRAGGGRREGGSVAVSKERVGEEGRRKAGKAGRKGNAGGKYRVRVGDANGGPKERREGAFSRGRRTLLSCRTRPRRRCPTQDEPVIVMSTPGDTVCLLIVSGPAETP